MHTLYVLSYVCHLRDGGTLTVHMRLVTAQKCNMVTPFHYGRIILPQHKNQYKTNSMGYYVCINAVIVIYTPGCTPALQLRYTGIFLTRGIR